MAAKKKTRHGTTQPEDERTAKAVLLRLMPATTRKLAAFAKRLGVSRSAFVAHLVESAAEAAPRCGGSCLTCAGRCAGAAPDRSKAE